MEEDVSFRERTSSGAPRIFTSSEFSLTVMRSTLPFLACAITSEMAISREPAAGRKKSTTTSAIPPRIIR